MEAVRSTNSKTVHSGLGRLLAMPRPELSDPLETLHSQTDSFLTAARLIRRGWTGDEKKTGFSPLDSSGCSLSKLQGNQDPIKISWKNPQSRRFQVVICSKTSEERETRDGGKQRAEVAFTEAERQTGLYSQADVTRIWTSGCRSTCRQFRRFKAPLLPVIAEM